MATRDSTTVEVNYLNSDPSSLLIDIIETERARLEKALTVLGCTKVAINNDPCADEQQFIYGDMIDMAREMIDQTTCRLDSVYLRPFYDRLASNQREASTEADASTQSAPSASNSASVDSAA